VCSLTLLAVFLGTLTAPPRLGSLSGRAEVIAALAAALLAWMPSVVYQPGRATAIAGILGLAIAARFALVDPSHRTTSHPESTLAAGWVLGATLRL
jgi:hypothetical protein